MADNEVSSVTRAKWKTEHLFRHLQGYEGTLISPSWVAEQIGHDISEVIPVFASLAIDNVGEFLLVGVCPKDQSHRLLELKGSANEDGFGWKVSNEQVEILCEKCGEKRTLTKEHMYLGFRIDPEYLKFWQRANERPLKIRR